MPIWYVLTRGLETSNHISLADSRGSAEKSGNTQSVQKQLDYDTNPSSAQNVWRAAVCSTPAGVL